MDFYLLLGDWTGNYQGMEASVGARDWSIKEQSPRLYSMNVREEILLDPVRNSHNVIRLFH